MHANELLHATFEKASRKLDKRLKSALFTCIDSVLNGAHLSAASLGRYLGGNAKTKNKIKRVDRLLSNPSLHKNFDAFYRDMSSLLISNHERPIVIIDASLLSSCGRYQFLSCSVPLGGRTLPLLEEAFLREDIQKQKTMNGFLERLSSILPQNCKPIVVTDAGFKNPWFKQIKNMGWDYIGRSCSNVMYLNTEDNNWYAISSLYSDASSKAEYVTTANVSKTSEMTHSIYRYKGKPKGRVKKNIDGSRSKASPDKKHSNRAKQPWILFSSLNPEDYQAKHIVKIYKKRMQIEEAFRDLKDDRHGLGLVYNRSKNIHKITVALLIGAISRYLLWALGLSVKKKKFHYSYQANTVRSRNVLSVFYIAKQFLREHFIHHKIKDPWKIVDLSALAQAVEQV